MPENDRHLEFKNGEMYVILSSINLPTQWHWGIFICIAYPWGQVYHATNREGYWIFEENMTEGLVQTRSIRAAVKLASLPGEDTISAIHNTLKTVPVQRNGEFVQKWGENFTCRVWVKEALETLKHKQLISFSSIDHLEQTIISKGIQANSLGTRMLFPKDLCGIY